jgi:uncharacterized membrane protein
MKKALVILCTLMMFCCLLSGCSKEEEIIDYGKYFNNFGSAPGIAEVTESLNLGKDVFVSSYDKNADLYITQKKIVIEGSSGEDDTVYNLYGFATAQEIILEPKYANVIDVRYNFAIVAKRVASGATTRTTIGMVKLRGDHVGREYGFSYEYTGITTQYSFLNDKYMVMFGDKTYTSTTAEFATVYDYTTANGLLEVGRIGNTTSATVFSMYDNYIAAVGTTIVRYYLFDKIDANGYFEMSLNGKYTPFKAEEGFTDTSLMTTSVFYIANGWFIETGIYRSTKEFTGYEQTEKDSDGLTYYLVNKSTRFNIRSGKRFATDRVKLVANKYSAEYTESLANTINYDIEIFSSDKMPLYCQPVMPVSALVKEGYSLVYYDFYYYDDDNNAQWGQTFAIYDQNAEIINPEDLVMPLLMVDGIGLQNSDPVFYISIRDFGYNKTDGTEVLLLPLEQTKLYDPVILNDGMLVGYRVNLETVSKYSNMMGAASVDGSSIIPFEFVEMTPFVNGYATGSKIQLKSDGSFDKRLFYRISKSGVLTELQNVYSLRNGVYITKENEKYGLVANDGTVLLNPEYDSISVIDNFLTDGVYFVNRVVGVRDGYGIIFNVTPRT